MNYKTRLTGTFITFIEELIEIAYYKGINEQRKMEILKGEVTEEAKEQLKELENEIEKLDKIILKLKNEITGNTKRAD